MPALYRLSSWEFFEKDCLSHMRGLPTSQEIRQKIHDVLEVAAEVAKERQEDVCHVVLTDGEPELKWFIGKEIPPASFLNEMWRITVRPDGDAFVFSVPPHAHQVIFGSPGR